MPLEPPLRVGLDMHIQVVYHDMYVAVAGNASIYGTAGVQELLVVVPLVELDDNRAVSKFREAKRYILPLRL